VPLLTILHVIAIAQARRWPARDAVQVAGSVSSLSA
jgi:hypothetical protein